MDHIIVLSYNYAKRKWWWRQTNAPRCRPLWWPCGDVEAIHVASPDAACPGLLRKPLDAAIGWLLAPYRLGGHQGDSKQNFDGHRDVAVLYHTHRKMEEVLGFCKSHRASTRSDINNINWTCQCWLLLTFHREKGLQLICWSLITIGVWHIKLTGTT